MRYDIAIIGGGPAGYTAAIRAAQYNLKVALIEEGFLGGTCLNRGCIPTKSLLHTAMLYKDISAAGEYGIECNGLSLNLIKAYNHKDNIVVRLREGVKSLMRLNKIDLIEGKGSFIDKSTIKVGSVNINAENIIIATGSRPKKLPIEGIEYALSSDEVLNAPVSGESIVIIGGGVIGVEFAEIYCALGRSVTILELSCRLIPLMDADLSNALTMSLKKKKVKIILNARLNLITKGESYTVEYSDQSGLKQITCDTVISATGREPYTEGLMLNNASLSDNLTVDNNMYTGSGRIYAAGDVTGGIQLAHYAAAEGITAVDSILNKPHSYDRTIVPSCIYTSPEIASVGRKQEECGEFNIEVGKFYMGGNAKALIYNKTSGFSKIIIDKDTEQVLGAHLFMPHATDIISELSLAIVRRVKREEFLRVIHPHPTISESIYESVEASRGMAINMPPKL